MLQLRFRCFSLNTFRERVYLKKIQEISETDAQLTCLKFSLDGKYLTLGFSNGNLLLLDIEFGHTFEKSFPELSDSTNQGNMAISSLWWLTIPEKEENISDFSDSPHSASSLSAAFLSSIEALHYDDLFENADNESSVSTGSHTGDKLQGLKRLFQQLSSSLLCVLLANGDFLILAYGIEILWKLNISSFLNDFKTSIEPMIVNDAVFLHFFSSSLNSSSSASAPEPPATSLLSSVLSSSSSHSSSSNFLLPTSFPLDKILELQRLSYLTLMISYYQEKGNDIITSNLSKKWKECIKTLPPKLSLLSSLLTNGYEMNSSTASSSSSSCTLSPTDSSSAASTLSLIEFLHTITCCGLWHPAALTSFSQHWNDQGINRLKGSVDSTTKYIIRCLQFKLFPLLMNMILLTK
jgi:hypothetical protein